MCLCILVSTYIVVDRDSDCKESCATGFDTAGTASLPACRQQSIMNEAQEAKEFQ